MYKRQVFDDLFADGQTEACAFGLVGEGVADLLEALEDFGPVSYTHLDVYKRQEES